MIKIFWDELKYIVDNNEAAFMYYADTPDYYIVWTYLGGTQIGVPKLFREDSSDFETNYKASSNPKESSRVRVRTSMEDQFLHSRFFSFYTSDNSKSVNNNNHHGISFGDIDYRMFDNYSDYDANTESSNASTATITVCDFAPAWSYSVENGEIFIPQDLEAGEWELHVVALPDTPLPAGTTPIKDHPLVANPSLELAQGEKLILDATMNQAYMQYSPYRTNVIRFLVKHPAAANRRFQVRMNLYRGGLW